MTVPDPTWARLDGIRGWLRMHGDYRLTLDPWALYGCWHVVLTGPKGYAASTHGVTLDKRLDAVERWMTDLDPVDALGRPWFGRAAT